MDRTSAIVRVAGGWLAVSSLVASLAGCHPAPPVAAPPASASSPAPAPASAPAAAKVRTSFAWPVPGRVGVVHRGHKDGHTVTMRYDLVLARAAPGQHEVRFERFQLVDIDGQDARDPELREAKREVERAGSVIPTMLVTPEGEYAGVTGMDRVIDVVLAQDKDLDPKKRAEMARFLRSPEVMASMEQKTGDYWNTWVGAWQGLELAPGQKWETTRSSAVPGGGVAEMRAVYEHHGAAPGEPGLVRLSMVSVLDGEQARAALSGAMEALMQQMVGKKGVGKTPRILSVRKENRVSVDTDPATLRPRRASLETSTVVQVEGGPERAKRQFDEYEFTWPAR